MDTKIGILFLASNPDKVDRLKLDEEIRTITTKITASKYRDVLDLISRWAVRPDDLLQELNSQRPTIVHFSGHGTSIGEIVLMDDSRQPKKVSPAALKKLFSTLKGNIRLVVLNACYSKIQADAISEEIDCVIGMKTEIGDNAAIAFASSFYRAIGFGRSIQDSFDQGITSLLLEGIPEEDTPKLLVRNGVDASSINLVESLTKPAVNEVTSGVSLIDKMAEQISILMKGQPELTVPRQFRFIIEREGDAIVSKNNGQENQRITADDLEKLPEPMLRHIKVYRESMENHYSRWASVYPQLALITEPSEKTKIENQLKDIVVRMKGDLEAILNFLEEAGLYLDDHYKYIRDVVRNA